MKNSSQHYYFGIAIALLGIVLFSAKAVLVKLIYNYNVPAMDALLFRMLFSLPFYFLMLFLYKPKHDKKIEKKDYAWLIVLGILGYYLASLFDFLGLKEISANLERIILFVYPSLVLVISFLILKTKIAKLQVFAVAITYIGVAIAFSGEQAASVGDKLLGSFYIFLSALCYASYLVGSHSLIGKFGAKTFTSYAMVISCICVIGHYLYLNHSIHFNFPTEVYLLCFAMAVFCTIIPSYLVSEAINRLGASDFSILSGLGPISTIALSAILLDEILNWRQGIGAAVVISGVYIITRYKEEKKL